MGLFIFIFARNFASKNYQTQCKDLNTSVPFANQQFIIKKEKRQQKKNLIVKKEMNVTTAKEDDASCINAANAKKLSTAKKHVR